VFVRLIPGQKKLTSAMQSVRIAKRMNSILLAASAVLTAALI
jgi:hypothetical protein